MYSSFHGQTVKAGATKHNNREHPPKYLLEPEKPNNDFKSYIGNRDEVLENIKEIVKNKTGRKMQKKAEQCFWQEAVINCKEDTKIEDIENLFKHLNKHFGGGFEVSEIAIHRDEGAFIQTDLDIKNIRRDSKTGEWFLNATGENVSEQIKAYMPNVDIFYNKEKKSWYLDKDFKKEIDTSKLQKYKNLHAHAIYNKFNYEAGKNIRLMKSDLQKIQDFTAQFTGLKRAKSNQNFKRRNHEQQKYFYKKIDEQKEQQLAKQKDLKEEIKRLREELQQEQAKREQYAQLEQLNRELKEQIKAKDLTIEEMNKRFEDFKKEKIVSETNRNSPKTQKTILDDKSIENDIKTISRANMSDFREEIDIKQIGIIKKAYKIELKQEFEDKPDVEDLSLFNKIKKNFKKLTEIIKTQASKIFHLENENKILRSENKELKKKLELSLATKQQNEENLQEPRRVESKVNEILGIKKDLLDFKKQNKEKEQKQEQNQSRNFNLNR